VRRRRPQVHRWWHVARRTATRRLALPGINAAGGWAELPVRPTTSETGSIHTCDGTHTRTASAEAPYARASASVRTPRSPSPGQSCELHPLSSTSKRACQHARLSVSVTTLNAALSFLPHPLERVREGVNRLVRALRARRFAVCCRMASPHDADGVGNAPSTAGLRRLLRVELRRGAGREPVRLLAGRVPVATAAAAAAVRLLRLVAAAPPLRLLRVPTVGTLAL
jgi:hypothetical protein